MDIIKEYYYKWQLSIKDDPYMTDYYKEKYRTMVLKSLERPYRLWDERLKMYPTIILN